MAKVAVTYSSEVGGSSVISLKQSFTDTGADVVDADFRELMQDIPVEKFNDLYQTQEGREKLFAHAKKMAEDFLADKDCIALSGNSAMLDPELFNQQREDGQKYDLSRTVAELALVHVAIQKGMPILGICGGHQVLAVYGGGTIANLDATQLENQQFMNYDKIQINQQTMLGQIIGVQTDGHEPDAFGAHNQRVDYIGEGYIVSGKDSSGETIESLESEHGVPIITTQFHPEVGAKGS